MRSLSLARAAAALLTGLVFVSANAAPIVCVAVHHGQEATDHGTAHHQHGPAPAPDASGTTVGAAQADAPPCADMAHCGVAVNGITVAATTVRVAVAHPGALPGGPAGSPHPAAFSPPTPPPRA